jgi:hypothetical protein
MPHRRRRRRRPPHLDAPGAEHPATGTPEAAAAAEGTPGNTGATEKSREEGGSQRQVLRLRNWRRHRRARPVPRLGSAEAGGGTPAQAGAAEGAVATEGETATSSETAIGDSPHLRPRRRRRRPRFPIAGQAPGQAGEAVAAEGAIGDVSAEAPTRPLGTRPPRSRNRRRRGPRAAVSANGATPSARADGRGGRDQRVGQARSDEARPGGARTDERRNGAGREDRRGERRGGQREGQREGGRRGPPGRGRGAPDRRPPPKLYSFDSVVDRGFDDVEEEGETRRVHWTILKRTTADQISRKPISAVYVLQRDGNDAEFPNLGSARSAVNKTIVHPEKLTRSKEEYAAEKNAKR